MNEFIAKQNSQKQNVILLNFRLLLQCKSKMTEAV